MLSQCLVLLLVLQADAVDYHTDPDANRDQRHMDPPQLSRRVSFREENLLLDNKGNVKLTDMGLAKAAKLFAVSHHT